MWTKSDVSKISQAGFKNIVNDSARANYDDDAKELPSYKGEQIEKFTLNISIGNNTTVLSGVLTLKDGKQVAFSSEWSRDVYNQFNNNDIYYIGPDWTDKSKGNRGLPSSPPLQGTKLNTSALQEAQFYYKANIIITSPPVFGSVATVDRTYVPAWETFIITLLPWVLIIGFTFWIFNRTMKMQGGGMNPFGMGKNKARQLESKINFSDVAGIVDEKDELKELVDYLKNPKKYQDFGARAPKGILLEGPPGTGKTLLAKALAGEAAVPFFSISGSEFEEVFVGLGASRIRSMFESAKKKAPCIIFIDEIDAMGRRRNSTGMSTSEQTLNQLLTEMDGFSENEGVIIMAATNLIEVLDPALLRPGRFDRKITLTLPSVKERKEILKLHAGNKNLSSAISFDDVAQKTPGFSGAQLENVLNEGAILSVRKNKKMITQEILDEAIDRVIGGPAKTSRKYSVRDKKIVSYHEAGHAVVGLKVKHAARVEKVTIIPRGAAGGYSILLPKEETFFYSKEQILSNIAGLLGGRASESIIFGDTNITTGAHDDLGRATMMARKLVAEYGMNKTLGFAQYEPPHKQTTNIDRVYSDEVAKQIDVEVKRILDQEYKTAHEVIKNNEKILHLIAEALLLLETINANDVKFIDKNKKLPPRFLKEKARQAKTKTNDSSETISEDDDIIEINPVENKVKTKTSKPNVKTKNDEKK